MEDRLRELIRENKVIPFVGAGVSKDIKYNDGEKVFPNWGELLELLIQDIDDENIKLGINSFFKSKKYDYLKIADMIEDELSVNEFNKSLQKVFKVDYNLINKTTYELSKAIWNLDTKLIITTNYDKVLHKACEDENISFWDIQSLHEQGNSNRDGVEVPTVWHLHGFENNPNDIILTSKKYNEFYTSNVENSKYKVALKTLQNTISTKSLLFIGFSLDDEFVVNQINKTIEIFGENTHEHYIYGKDGFSSKNLNKNIKLITYKNHGQPLIDKINSLKPITKNIEPIADEPKIEPQPTKDVFHSLTSLPAENKEYFIGREKELEEIEEKLSSNSLIYIVNGIGGVGKSEISSRYFHQNKNKYKNVAFIEMTEESPSLEDVFKTKFKKSLSLEDEDTFDTVIQRLQNLPQRNLLFLDNIEKKEDFEKVKALNVSFDLLITTRITNLSVKNQLNLDTLNPKDAKDLFLSIYDEDENIKDILTYLDNHPLFITLTASSLEEEYLSLDELRENIKNKTISKIDSKENKTFEEHLQSTFDKQFLSVEKEELKNLLQVLSFFPSIEIDYEILKKSIAIDNLKSKLQKLVKQGWLNKKDNTYKLHQIIKTFIYDKYPLEYEDVSFVLKNIGNYVNPDDSTLIANKLDGYIPIIESFLSIFKDKEDENICAMLDSLTYILYSQGLYQESLDIQNKAFGIRQKIFDTKSEFIARSQYLLSIIYQDMGEYKKALEYSEKALKLREKILGDKHPDLASSYNKQASIYRSIGEYKKALAYSEQALNLREDILEDEDFDLASSYSMKSLIYKDMGDYSKSLEYSEKNLKLSKIVLGNKHPYLSTGYNDLSLVYADMGDYLKALEYAEKSLIFYKEILGENHPSLSTSYNNLATIYQNMGKYKKALEYSIKAIALREELLGMKHPYLAISYNNEALIYKDMGNYLKALEYSEKALRLREEIFEEKHPDLANSYISLSSIYQDMKEYKKALAYSEKALNLYKEKLEESNPLLAINYNNISTIYQDMGEYTKALEYSNKALKLRIKVLSNKHPDLATGYNNMALIYQSMKEYEKALKYLEKSLIILEEILDEKHHHLAVGYNNIASIYKDLKLCKKVKENIEKAINIWKESEYHGKQLFRANQLLKDVNYYIKKESKLKPNKRGKFCKDL